MDAILICHYLFGISEISLNIVIKEPALVLVHLGDEKKKFFVDVFSLYAIFL